jgi:hypothetical protein
MGKRGLPFDGCPKSSHAPSHGARNQHAGAIAPDFREKGFKLPAYARQIRVDRVRFDVTGEEYYVEGQGVLGRINRQVVKVAESKI